MKKLIGISLIVLGLLGTFALCSDAAAKSVSVAAKSSAVSLKSSCYQALSGVSSNPDAVSCATTKTANEKNHASQAANAKAISTTVALVIDRASYAAVKPQLESYAEAIAKYDGKKTETVICARTTDPDSIRTILKNMYKSERLEGAILIGYVPIPMIRDAQHLTSAFKMDQSRDWKESSVPSDRFYDDFDLVFKDLGADKDIPYLHYFSLQKDGPQQIGCDIYSSRIKVPAPTGTAASEINASLGAFLAKAAKAKAAEPEALDQMLYFAGQGYNSDCVRARVDERGALMHQFPYVEKHGRLDYINFDDDDYVKFRLRGALAQPGLDFALLHHHGAEDTQYMSRTPYANMAQSYIDNLRSIFRNKIRDAKDTAKAKAKFIKEYGVPEAWVNDAFDKDNILKDSTASADINMHIEDLAGYVSSVRFLIIDACYTGAFNNDDYISAHYLFNPGQTLVVRANTVNALQDQWVDELMGLNGLGVCAGKWAMGGMTLESHLLGDATSRFKCSDSRYEGLDAAMSDPKTDWTKYMKSDNPEVKCLAVKRLFHQGKLSTADLLKLQKEDPSELVRLEAFDLQSKTCDSNLEEALSVALKDNYELASRLGAKFAEIAGYKSLLPQIVSMYLDPRTSSRVSFHLRDAMQLYPADEVIKVADSVRNATQCLWPSAESYLISMKSLKSGWESSMQEFKDLGNNEIKDKEKSFTISGQRNGCNPYAVEPFLEYIGNQGNNAKLRQEAVEALGWYRCSVRKADIISALKKLAPSEKDEAVRYEIERTIARLK